jgi:hypothetical protein
MTYSDEEMRQIMQVAAKQGAKECMEDMGITPENVHEVKNMLDVFKAIKRGALNGLSKIIMLIVIAAALAFAGVYGINIKGG